MGERLETEKAKVLKVCGGWKALCYTVRKRGRQAGQTDPHGPPSETDEGWISCGRLEETCPTQRRHLHAGPSQTALAPPSPFVRSHLRSQLWAGPSLTSPPSPTLPHLLLIRAFGANSGLAPPSPLVRSCLRALEVNLEGGGGGPFLGPPPNALSLLPSGAMFPFAL